MPFPNPPFDDLYVPDTAGQLLPGGGRGQGIVITADVPAAIQSNYGGIVSAVVLYFSSAETTYWYTAMFSNVRAHGYVFNETTVRELYRETVSGDPAVDPALMRVGGIARLMKADFAGPYTNRMMAVATRVTAQSITNTPLNFTSVPLDFPTGASAPGTAPIVIPYNGWYSVEFTGEWASSSGGYRALGLLVNTSLSPGNESKVPGPPVATTMAHNLNLPPLLLTAGDIIGVNAFTNTAAINFTASRLSVKLEHAT